MVMAALRSVKKEVAHAKWSWNAWIIMEDGSKGIKEPSKVGMLECAYYVKLQDPPEK